jgi:hypothetical protein
LAPTAKSFKTKERGLIIGGGELRRVNGRTVEASAYELMGEVGTDGSVRVWKKRNGGEDWEEDDEQSGEEKGEEEEE